MSNTAGAYKPGTAIPSQALQFIPGFDGGVDVVNLFYFVLCRPIICLPVLCSDVRYNFPIKMMFGSSLPPVVCRRAHLLLTLFVFVFA
jgi:hypothetical protein